MTAPRPAVPRLARALVLIAAAPADKAALAGDLEEEFAQLADASPGAARRWYWRQASMSLPHLLLRRLRGQAARRFGVAVFAAFGALAFSGIWDLYIARGVALGFYSLSGADDYGAVRLVFLFVQIGGVALAGAIIAHLTFLRERSFAQNLIARLLPVGLVFFAPAALEIARASPDYPVWFRLVWMAFAAPALVVGAWGASRLRRRRR